MDVDPSEDARTPSRTRTPIQLSTCTAYTAAQLRVLASLPGSPPASHVPGHTTRWLAAPCTQFVACVPSPRSSGSQQARHSRPLCKALPEPLTRVTSHLAETATPPAARPQQAQHEWWRSDTCLTACTLSKLVTPCHW